MKKKESGRGTLNSFYNKNLEFTNGILKVLEKRQDPIFKTIDLDSMTQESALPRESTKRSGKTTGRSQKPQYGILESLSKNRTSKFVKQYKLNNKIDRTKLKSLINSCEFVFKNEIEPTEEENGTFFPTSAELNGQRLS